MNRNDRLYYYDSLPYLILLQSRRVENGFYPDQTCLQFDQECNNFNWRYTQQNSFPFRQVSNFYLFLKLIDMDANDS